METFSFDQDKFLDPPEDIQHLPECPLAQDKPWRPATCICPEIAESRQEYVKEDAV